MALTAEQLAQQKKQAEELLFSGPETLGFAKGLFFGHFNSSAVMPYPVLDAETQARSDAMAAAVAKFCAERIDAVAIDRNADIPREVILGLGELGVLGMTAPEEFGGRGFKQQSYCKSLEVIGGHCSSTAVFVNAHHSIGIRALLLFGTEAQRERWLRPLVRGEKLAAFALTETNAGSDAANVQTMATPTPDGSGYILNGDKRYITNGGIADVLTVMARTPVPGSDETKITAFLVTPDMPGFKVIEARAVKCGIRGTATGKIAFHDMFVPKENILGQVGKGLRLALTVLDYGRTTFGATCTGAARTCLNAAIQHAKTRVQFKQPIGEFELVRKKIAFMAAHLFAMEATTQICAAFIDRGAEDYMLETAILKVFATEHLWTIVNDTIQIFGGKAYFCDEPYERMMRDARINTIGEGANEVLKAFIAVVGSRGPGLDLKAVGESVFGFLSDPLRGFSAVSRFVGKQASARLSLPDVPVQSRSLQREARVLARLVGEFGLAVQSSILSFASLGMKDGEAKFLTSQLMHEKLADVAMDLYAASCSLSRLDYLVGKSGTNGHANGNGRHYSPIEKDIAAGKHFLTLAFRRIRHNLDGLTNNDHASTLACAEAWMS